VAGTDGKADVKQIFFKPIPELWKRPPGRLHSTWLKNITDDLSAFDNWTAGSKRGNPKPIFLKAAGFA